MSNYKELEARLRHESGITNTRHDDTGSFSQKQLACLCGADAIADLRARLAEAEKRANESDNQLVWLAGWCERTTGVRNNLVIGRDGWPNVLVEVVAQAVETERDALRADNARLWACVKAADAMRKDYYEFYWTEPNDIPETVIAYDAARAALDGDNDG